MKKHAYLIMAYNQFEQLKKLIELLDDERNDIYVHIDADADFPMEELKNISCQKGKLFVVERISVMWADYSQIEAEMRLLQAATENDFYHYYHLLSGMDMPLKTQDEIHEFFEDKDREFIAVVPIEGKYQIEHVKFHYPLLKIKKFRKSKFLKLLNNVFVFLQKCVGINRIKKWGGVYHFYDGWQWFSITDNFARYLLNKEYLIHSIFKGTKAPDEMVLQTIAMNSSFREKLYDTTNLENGSLRKIDWKRGSPYTWQIQDFVELIDSPYMFARKLDIAKDAQIVERIYSYLSKGKSN